MDTNKINYKSVRDGSSEDCIQKLCSIIKDDLKLCQDQVVSISLHDSRVRHGDLEAVVFYREQTTKADSEPLADSLEFKLVERDEDTKWTDVLAESLVNANQSPKAILAIGATFRNVGEEKIAAAVSFDGPKRELFEKRFSAKASWGDLVKQAEQFLNKFIAPSDFHSIVAFEQEHPLEEREAETGTRNVVVYHYAGDGQSELQPLDFDSKLYSLTVIEAPEEENWDNMYERIVQNIDSTQQIQGHFVATMTSSDK